MFSKTKSETGNLGKYLSGVNLDRIRHCSV